MVFVLFSLVIVVNALIRSPWPSLAGLLVIVVAFTNSLFSVAPSFEDLTDGFRDTVMTDEAIAQAQQDIGALAAVNEEFPLVVQGLAGAFEMDAAGFQQMLGSEFPNVAAGVEALPASSG